MNFDEFQRVSVQRGRMDQPLETMQAVFALGLTGESGEVADMIKKHLGHGHELDADKLLKELGDVLWYIAALAHINGWLLSEVAQANVDKLALRYPQGFSCVASKARADEKPASPSVTQLSPTLLRNKAKVPAPYGDPRRVVNGPVPARVQHKPLKQGQVLR